MSNEADLYSWAKDFQQPACLVGTVGWEGREEYVDFGSEDNDGFTFVYVTLYAGKTPGTKTTEGVAQGRQIICHINSLAGARIPKKGTRVYVLIPHGMMETPGAGVIVAAVEKTASKDQLEKDRVVLDFGEDVHVVIKGKSVSLSDHDNRFLTVGTPRAGGDPGLLFQAADGSGGVIQEGKLGWFVAEDGDSKQLFQMTTTQTEMWCKGGGMWKVDASGFLCAGAVASVRGAAVYLGALPTALTGACIGPNIAAGLTSLTVFISP